MKTLFDVLSMEVQNPGMPDYLWKCFQRALTSDRRIVEKSFHVLWGLRGRNTEVTLNEKRQEAGRRGGLAKANKLRKKNSE